MAELTKVDAGFATIGQGAGPMMVTWKAGLFQKHGLDIERPRIMGGAKGIVRGLMSGEIQFGNMAAPAPLRANLKGEADVIFLTGGINQQFILGRPGIDDRSALAGKKIGFVGDGGINDALVKFVIDKLEAAGVKGLKPEPMAAGGARELESLLSGHVDAVVGTPPECIDLARNGCKYLIDFSEFGFNYALGGIAARRDYVARNPEITRKFVKAYVEGMHRYRTDREFTIGVQAEYSGIADRTVAEATYDLTRPGMPRIPYPVVTALQTLIDFMAKDLPEAKNADAARFIDDRYMRELDESGFIDSLGALNHARKDPTAMKLQYCVKFAMAAFLTVALSPPLVSPLFSATVGNEALIEAARREGELVYYASMNLGEANAIIGEFEKRYPFIKVKLNRTGSEKLLAKVMTEYRAKKLPADVIQTVEFSMHLINRAGVLAQYIPQANLQYPNEFKEDGFWTTVYYNPYVVAYNSKLVPRQMAPKRYEDLLDPKWKGKMMMDGTKADWFAGILQIMGQERGLKYMRDLGKQQPSPREGHELLAQLVAAGEGLMDINIPIASVERMKERGAPIDWTAVGAAPAIMVGIGISSQATHPNAAKLYIDFALSREGQRLIRTPGRLGARMDLAQEQADLLKEVKIVPVNPALAEKLGEYAKQLRSIFGG